MHTSDSHQPKNSGSGFLSGVTVGVLLGVAGYYLFGTKEGKNVRDKVVTEWQKAEKKIGNSPALETASEYWQTAFGTIAKELGFQRLRKVATQKTKALIKPATAFVKKAKVIKKAATKFSNT